MRFLVDECLSARLAALLTAAGHDAVHLRERGLLGATDDVVMAAAFAESRIVISADTDFGELQADRRGLRPSFVLFRRHGRTPEVQSSILLAKI